MTLKYFFIFFLRFMVLVRRFHTFSLKKNELKGQYMFNNMLTNTVSVVIFVLISFQRKAGWDSSFNVAD